MTFVNAKPSAMAESLACHHCGAAYRDRRQSRHNAGFNMVVESGSHESQEPCVLGRWIVERAGIWQMRLLDDLGLDSFARDRGVTSFSLGRHIRDIWQVGLLNADIVASPSRLNIEGLTLVTEGQAAEYLYADERALVHRSMGWGNALEEIQPISLEVELRFHPFRYYVLYEMERRLRLTISPIQMLAAVERYGGMLESEIQRFQQLSADSTFSQSVRSWNRAAALIIAAEPCLFPRLFGLIKYSPFVGLASQEQQLNAHWADVARCYRAIGLEQLKKVHQQLCFAATSLDPNNRVHTILRLTRGEWRLNEVKGNLGGAMCVISMAEMLRRAAEEVFQTALPEEDETGFGSASRAAKERLYGEPRVVDADRRVKNQFLRTLGLDYSLRLRWYVEGDTEFHAIDAMVGDVPAVELIDLKGQVTASRGKGLAFRDNLLNDQTEGIFSFVSVDGDRSDFVHAVRKAAEDDEICGMFFVSTPDFEFENFTTAELEQILWSIATEVSTTGSRRSALRASIADAKCAKEMFVAVRSAIPELAGVVGKGEEWGKRLGAFALKNPEKTDQETGQTQTRPIIEAFRYAVQSITADYRASRARLRVDPSTGRPIRRPE